jgi:uncharacterized protein YecT (DUF1311 family)
VKCALGIEFFETESAMPLLLLFLIVFAPAAGAQAEDCGNATVQTAMNECADLAFRKADDELNALFNEARRRLKSGNGAEKSLMAAERAWIGFRDAECSFSASSSKGGTIYPMIYSECLEKLTKARIDGLKRFMQCEEGDLSCPVPPAAK